jgi:hypothetical protein
MDSNDYLDWCSVRNTVENRIQLKQLTYTHLPKKKILKVTKLTNKKVRKCSNIRSYKAFVKTKKKILSNLTDYLNMTDESDFTDDDYTKLKYSSQTSYFNDTSANFTDDCFLWLHIDKKGSKETKPKKKGIKSVIKNEIEYNDEINDLSSQTSSNSSINTNDVNNINSKVMQNKNSPVKEKKNLNPENVIGQKHFKHVKKNKIIIPKTNSTSANNLESSDEWDDEFITSDFQAHSTKIFSNPNSEINKINSRLRSRFRLSQIETITQPRDSGIEEDSREDNKHDNLDNNTNKKHRTVDVQINEDNTTSKALENILDKSENIKLVNNLNEVMENKEINGGQIKKIPLKIIGEERVAMKYKIINNQTKDLNIISKEEQNLILEDRNINIDEKAEYNNKRDADLDVVTNLVKSKKNIEKLNSLNNNSNDEDSINKDHFDSNKNSPVYIHNESDNEELISEVRKKDINKLRDKLKNSKSAYVKRQYRELKQTRSINSDEDLEYKSDIVNNKENSMQESEIVIQNNIDIAKIKKDKYNLFHDEQNLILSNKKQCSQEIITIDTSQLSNNESSNSDRDQKINKKTINSLKNESSEINKDEIDCDNKIEETEKNMLLNVNKDIEANEISKIDKNNISNIIPNIRNSQVSRKNSINMEHSEIDQLKSYTISDEYKNIESETYNSHEHFVALNAHSPVKNVQKALLDESKIETKNYDIKEESKHNLDCKNKENEQKQFDICVELISSKKPSVFKEKKDHVIDETEEQSSIIEDKNLSHHENCSNKIENQNLLKIDKVLDECNNISNNSSLIDSNNIDIEAEEQSVLSFKNLTDKNIKNDDKRISNNIIRRKNRGETLKSNAGGDDHCIEEIPDVNLQNSNSNDKIVNDKHNETIDYNSEINEDDQEIDVGTLSPKAYKRLKSLKRLDLFRSSEDESDLEELIRCKKLQKNFESDLKSIDNDNTDNETQDVNIETLSPNTNQDLKLPVKENLHKEEEDKSLKLIEVINNKNSDESVDVDEDDEIISASAVQKLSQFKKINFFNNSESSSEDEQCTESNNIIMDNLVPYNGISQKQTDLITKISDLHENDVKSNNESNLNNSFIDKALNVELVTKDNKTVKSAIEMYKAEDIQSEKITCVEKKNNIEEIKHFDQDDKNKSIINETQESLDTQQIVEQSQEMFLSLDVLKENLNVDQINANKKSDDLTIISQIPPSSETKEPIKTKKIKTVIKIKNNN